MSARLERTKVRSEPKRKGSSRRSGGASGYSLATTSLATRKTIEASLRVTGPPVIPEAIPFNGLLTNKVLASLPGSDFKELLRHLEPV